MAALLGSFFLISLSGALSPGPLTTMAFVEGSRRGRWAGWWLALGHGLIEAVYFGLLGLALWWGRESLLTQPLIVGLIALAGGGFLAWMGWGLGRAAWAGQLSLQGAAAQQARLGLVPTGVAVTVSNPYWWIWWALIPPIYIQQAMAWGVAGLILLYVIHWLTDFFWLTGLAWLTGSGRSFISERVYRWVMLACGAILFVFGLSFVGAGLTFLFTGQVSL